MGNTDFEKQVLESLSEIKTDVSEIKTDVSGLKTDVSSLHNKFDKLDDRLDNVETNLKQEIRMQGAYLNQAFDRMSYMQSVGQYGPKK